MGAEIIIGIAGLVVAAGSATYSAVQQNKAEGRAENQMNQQAAMEKAAAEAEAANIREKGRRIQASQSVTLAASGVKLDGQGSGEALLSETTRLTEKDALAAITGGRNRATLLEGEAGMAADRGNAALVTGGLNVASTLIGGASNYQKSKQGSVAATNMNKKTSLDLGSTYTATKPKYTLLG